MFVAGKTAFDFIRVNNGGAINNKHTAPKTNNRYETPMENENDFKSSGLLFATLRAESFGSNIVKSVPDRVNIIPTNCIINP